MLPLTHTYSAHTGALYSSSCVCARLSPLCAPFISLPTSFLRRVCPLFVSSVFYQSPPHFHLIRHPPFLVISHFYPILGGRNSNLFFFFFCLNLGLKHLVWAVNLVCRFICGCRQQLLFEVRSYLGFVCESSFFVCLLWKCLFMAMEPNQTTAALVSRW